MMGITALENMSLGSNELTPVWKNAASLVMKSHANWYALRLRPNTPEWELYNFEALYMFTFVNLEFLVPFCPIRFSDEF